MSNHKDYLTILSPEKAVDWDNQLYYQLANEHHFWIEGRFLNLFKDIQKLNLETTKELIGLDIGCGNSVTSTQFEKRTQWCVDGTDLDLNGLKHKSTGRGKVYLYDILEQREEFAAKYDFLILFDVLEHIEDAQTFLNACLFHLKPSGYLFINVPAMKSLISPYDTVQGHFRRYDKNMLFELLEASNVKTLKYHFWGFLMLPFLYLRKLQPKKSISVEETIAKGFKPKNEFIHSILRFMTKFEYHCLPKPFAGTSLMVIAQKASS